MEWSRDGRSKKSRATLCTAFNTSWYGIWWWREHTDGLTDSRSWGRVMRQLTSFWEQPDRNEQRRKKTSESWDQWRSWARGNLQRSRSLKQRDNDGFQRSSSKITKPATLSFQPASSSFSTTCRSKRTWISDSEMNCMRHKDSSRSI